MPYEKTEPVYRDKAKTIKEPGIWRLADGGYLAEVSYADPHTGKRIRERKTTHRLDLAQEWIRARKTDALRGEVTRKKKRDVVLFEKFAKEYFKAWSLERKPSTAEREKRRIEGEINPHFGSKALHTITRKEIEDFITRKRDGGISAASGNRLLCRIKNMLKKAVDWGYIDSNPAAGIKQAREVVKESGYLEKDEVAALLQACGSRLRPVLVTAVYTGMRFGELMGLEWRNVDFERGFITLRDTKNSETRFVPMNPAVKEALEDHRRRQAQETGSLVPLVFPNPRTGVPYKELRKGFRKALDDAGITRHIRFHDLRHTAASHLVMAGVDLRTVGKILAHKTAQITLRYAHLAPDFLKGAVDRLDFSIPAEEGETHKGEAQ